MHMLDKVHLYGRPAIKEQAKATKLLKRDKLFLSAVIVILNLKDKTGRVVHQTSEDALRRHEDALRATKERGYIVKPTSDKKRPVELVKTTPTKGHGRKLRTWKKTLDKGGEGLVLSTGRKVVLFNN